MNVPILQLKDILLTTIQFDLGDEEALGFQEDLLETLERTEAAGVIIDITGMEIVDSFMARILNDTASMIRLLGAEAVICGIQPAVAMTLVEMGRELIGVETALNLDQGMDALRDLIDRRLDVLRRSVETGRFDE
ncbi:MAG: STAS domain-containing protein [Pseudomonadota bacterium]